MKKWALIFQIAFTFVGTIVGAGFATGQEIIQFFTRYGWMATWTILLSTALFIGVGTKLMTLSADLNARSYEDLNRHLFGKRWGKPFSLFMLVMLLGTSTVMLAGAGSVFSEHLGMPYQIGLFITIALAYVLLINGLSAIIAVNSFVVPFMILCSGLAVFSILDTSGSITWSGGSEDYPILRLWTAPLLYTAFNLATAQAVLVPLGSTVKDKSIIRWGVALGGLVIGAMLLAGHFALSARMPAIAGFEIPMGNIIGNLGRTVQWMYLLVIYGEIFTTFIADVYGLALQIQQRTNWSMTSILAGIMVLTYLFGQIGFSSLLSTLYPLFGMVSMIWFTIIIWRDRVMPN